MVFSELIILSPPDFFYDSMSQRVYRVSGFKRAGCNRLMISYLIGRAAENRYYGSENWATQMRRNCSKSSTVHRWMKTKMKRKDWNNMKNKIINRKIVWKRSPFSRCQHPSPARLPGSYNRRLQAKYNFRKTTIISSTNRNREMYEVEDVKCSWKYMKALK